MRPLGAVDLARFHHAPGVRRQAARLQADDVGDIDRGQRLAAAGQVAGAEDLEVVRRGVAGEAQVLLALAEDFVDDGGGHAVAAEAADGEVVAVVDQTGDGVGDGGELIGQGTRLARRRPARARSADGSVKRSPSPWEKVHGCSRGKPRA